MRMELAPFNVGVLHVVTGSIRSTGKYEATVRLSAELVARLALQVVAAK